MRIWWTVALLMVAPGQLDAEAPPPLERLLTGPAAFLLTVEERATAEAIDVPSTAARFVELFWARRDPDLSTSRNEFREDFLARTRAADAQFGTRSRRGALTDRGRALLLLGMPTERRTGSLSGVLDALDADPRLRNDDGSRRNTRIGEEQDVQRMLSSARGPVGRRGDFQDVAPDARFRDEADPGSLTSRHGVRFDPAKGTADIWIYGRTSLSAGPDLPEEVWVVFFDRLGDSTYELQTTIRGARPAVQALATAPAASVVHPDLERAPSMPLMAGVPPASETQLGWLRQPSSLTPRGAHALLVRGVAGVGRYPAWVAVQVPTSEAGELVAVGRMLDADGVGLGSFRRPVKAVPDAAGPIVELSLPVPSAGVKLQLAVAAAGQPLAVWTLGVPPAPADDGATFLGAVVAGARVVEDPRAVAGAPFVFGGYHVIPRLDGRYAAGEALNYFCPLGNLGRDEAGELRVGMRLRLYREGQSRPIATTPRQPAEPSALAPWVHMLGSQLPLDALPGPGAYRLEVSVVDRVSGVERTSLVPFEIVADEADPAS